jgi:hypothetical protein
MGITALNIIVDILQFSKCTVFLTLMLQGQAGMKIGMAVKCDVFVETSQSIQFFALQSIKKKKTIGMIHFAILDGDIQWEGEIKT